MLMFIMEGACAPYALVLDKDTNEECNLLHFIDLEKIENENYYSEWSLPFEKQERASYVALAPDCSVGFLVEKDTIYILSPEKGAIIDTIKIEQNVTHPLLSLDSKKLSVSSADSQSIYTIDTQTKEIKNHKIDHTPYSKSNTGRKNEIFFYDETSFYFLDVEKNEITKKIDHDGFIDDALSDGEAIFYLCGANSGQINTKTGNKTAINLEYRNDYYISTFLSYIPKIKQFIFYLEDFDNKSKNFNKLDIMIFNTTNTKIKNLNVPLPYFKSFSFNKNTIFFANSEGIIYHYDLDKGDDPIQKYNLGISLSEYSIAMAPFFELPQFKNFDNHQDILFKYEKKKFDGF